MQLMSFALTEPQIHDRTKGQTRRRGWKKIKVGQLICAVNKCMGLKPGEKQRRLAILIVTAVRFEKLYQIRPSEPAKEGFPELSCDQFVEMFSRKMKCSAADEVTVIDFKYVPGGRYPRN